MRSEHWTDMSVQSLSPLRQHRSRAKKATSSGLRFPAAHNPAPTIRYRGQMPRAPAMLPEDRRAQILDAARRVFAAQGYHPASVADIVTEAGVARGTFYNYFDSKRAVFQAVLEELTLSVEAAIRPISPKGDVRGQVQEMLVDILGAALEGGSWRLLFTEAVGVDAEGDALVRGFYARALGRLEKALATGQLLGLVEEGDPRLMARCLLGMVKEPAFQAALAGETPDLHALAEQMCRMLLGGVVRS